MFTNTIIHDLFLFCFYIFTFDKIRKKMIEQKQYTRRKQRVVKYQYRKESLDKLVEKDNFY